MAYADDLELLAPISMAMGRMPAAVIGILMNMYTTQHE